jgi:hypothetical protein
MTRLGSTPDINYSIKSTPKHFVTSLYFLKVNDSLNLLKMAFLFAKVITSILSFIATHFFFLAHKKKHQQKKEAVFAQQNKIVKA